MFQMILRLDQQVADPNDVGGFPLERDTKVLRDDRELAPLFLHMSNFRLVRPTVCGRGWPGASRVLELPLRQMEKCLRLLSKCTLCSLEVRRIKR